jgi:hypothetical protein
MTNRLISNVHSDSSDLATIVSSFFLDPRNRILELSPTFPKTKIYMTGKGIPVKLNDKWWVLDTPQDITITSILDTGVILAGKDYNFYVCDNNGVIDFKISLNSTFPLGFTADTSYKLGGFHTLCWLVGTAAYSYDWLYGYDTKDILPYSIWDLRHRPKCEPAGMVFIKRINLWCDIYLSSGGLGYFVSVYLGTPTDDAMWIEVAYWGHPPTNKRLPTDSEFSTICLGAPWGFTPSPIFTTTGGNTGEMTGQTPLYQRLVSGWGVEDCTAAFNQWLDNDIFRDNTGGTFTTGQSILSHGYGGEYACKDTTSSFLQLSMKMTAHKGSSEFQSGPLARATWPSRLVPWPDTICTRGVCDPIL